MKDYPRVEKLSCAKTNFKIDQQCIKVVAWCLPPTSVTRLGNLLDFGQLFKAFGNN